MTFDPYMSDIKLKRDIARYLKEREQPCSECLGRGYIITTTEEGHEKMELCPECEGSG